MTEADAIEQVDEPLTVSSLASDLRDLGVGAGDTLLVHASLSSLGWVSVGPTAVVDALQTVLTDSGTLVMQTHTGQYSDPEVWQNPPVPDDWVQTIRDTRPPFRPEVTPTRGMGAVPECFRNYPGVVRSGHPVYSAAAWGADAEEIVADHSIDHGLGEKSPIARVYDQDGDVLHLGTGYSTNTSLHLAEYRADFEKEYTTLSAPILRDGERVVIEYDDLETSTDDFEELGADFEADVGVTEGTIGAATCKLMDQPALVDFAVEWFEANR
ncbi:aminoglycoside N(3)-acetyltransferase [Haloferax sp. S1W]|uniref:aminoglycoside N(3)-acetyltransferase n=1 Tax=Haloferax sp. S1W TaxID=3377110 RepID=UPI0037CB782D